MAGDEAVIVAAFVQSPRVPGPATARRRRLALRLGGTTTVAHSLLWFTEAAAESVECNEGAIRFLEGIFTGVELAGVASFFVCRPLLAVWRRPTPIGSRSCAFLWARGARIIGTTSVPTLIPPAQPTLTGAGGLPGSHSTAVGFFASWAQFTRSIR